MTSARKDDAGELILSLSETELVAAKDRVSKMLDRDNLCVWERRYLEYIYTLIVLKVSQNAVFAISVPSMADFGQPRRSK
jgi:hypothetical protein